MKYDDTPAWQKENTRQETGYQELVPRVIRPWQGFKPTDNLPSENLRWFQREYDKRANKEVNELDLIDIKNVRKGFTNTWSKTIKGLNELAIDNFLRKPDQKKYIVLLELKCNSGM